MTSEQNQKRKMNMQVVKYIDQVPAPIIASMPNFENIYAKLKALHLQFDNLLEVQQRDLSGVTEEKGIVRQKLTAIALVVAAKITAYAERFENVVLLSFVNYKKRELDQMTQLRLRSSCAVVYDAAVKFQTALAEYGLTPEVLAQFAALNAQYIKVIPTPQIASGTKTIATEGLKTGIKAMDKLLATLDGLVNMMADSEPDFYNMYYRSRKVRRPGYRALSAKGTVRDSSGVPISFVTMSCDALGLSRRVSKKGGFKLSQEGDGVYEVRFEKAGYETVVVFVSLFKGVRVEVDVVMMKL